MQTKSGQLLTPFLVEGTTVHCFDESKRTIYKKLIDFDFTIGEKTKEKNVISVLPITAVKQPKTIPEKTEAKIEKIIADTIIDKPTTLPDIVQPNVIQPIDIPEPEKVIVERVPIIRNYEEQPEIQYSDSPMERAKELEKELVSYGTVTDIDIDDDNYI